MKIEPRLIIDRHSIFPPSASQIYFEMLRPRPRALTLSNLLLSSLEDQNCVKTYFLSFSKIPMPLSDTETSNKRLSNDPIIFPVMIIGSPSRCENLIAFFIKFMKTYLNLLLSNVIDTSLICSTLSSNKSFLLERSCLRISRTCFIALTGDPFSHIVLNYPHSIITRSLKSWA